ncbi:DnaJ-related protein scj1 [Vanrija albida]|uniref:DnaJ-related protein scj1 n=1 Tax=Vanrija albida TaxID=181172 RepID=A0ABR3Q270_9TREE
MLPRPLFWAIGLILLSGALAKTYYSVLGIDRSADDSDIKRAYRKLSKKFHPDINPDESAHEKFIEVARAYEVLSDSELRTIYDRGGEAGLKRHEERKNAPNDPFAQFFGGGGRQEPPRGPSVLTNLDVPLADMYTGRTVEFTIPRRVICTGCHGSGAHSPADVQACTGCGGQGVVVQKHQVFPGMFTNVQMTCPHCNGKGEKITRQCAKCGGERTVQAQNILAVHVPAGAPEGYEEVFSGEADQSPDFDAGDVIVRVRSQAKSNRGWTRKESGLVGRVTLSVAEALLGFERNVTSLDGRTIPLGRSGTTQPGEVEVIEGEGMPSYHDIPQGDMYIEYSVVFPTSVSDGTRKKLVDVFGGSIARDEL